MTVSKGLIQNITDLKKSLTEISVYDLDVYTSLELYYNIARKLNEVISELSRFEGVVSDEVIKQNEALVYLLGEGLTTEVIKKINQMVADGTMDTIINHNVFNKINDRINDISVNVINFNAKGDGATLNNTAIQNTIDFVSSLGGGTVYLPAGSYLVKADSKKQSGVVENKGTIILKENVKIKGAGIDKTIIKVSNDSNDWECLFYNQYGHNNISFEDLTIDSVNDINITEFSNWGRVPINFNGGYNFSVKNCRLIINGRWAIRAKTSNSNFSDNIIDFKLKQTNFNWFDTSCIWCGGENNIISNNIISVKECLSNIKPVCGIEFQGHRNKVYNNIINGFETGILPTASTCYMQNDYYMLSELGANSNSIYNNKILNVWKGIHIWGMHVDEKSVISDMSIYDNYIYINTDDKVSGEGRRVMGIGFHVYLNGTVPPTEQAGDQIASFKNGKIYNNIIEFKTRYVNRNLSTGENAISFLVDINVDNVDIYSNTILNCGGVGIGLDVSEYDGADNYIKYINIHNNTFKNTLVPVRLYNRLENISIQNNVFSQDVLYSKTSDNMYITIQSENVKYTKTKNITILNNTINCVDNLKPFYPIYHIEDIELSYYPVSRGMILQDNQIEGKIIEKQINGSCQTIPKNYLLKDSYGKLLTPRHNTPSSVGDLSVKISEVILNDECRLSDTSKINANQSLKLNSTKFVNGLAYVLAVVGNNIKSTSTAFVTQSGYDRPSVVGETITYYDTFTEVESSTNWVENGSNANGRYTKFGSGLLICEREVTVDLTNTSLQEFAFPHNFVGFVTGSLTGSTGTTSISNGILTAMASMVCQTNVLSQNWAIRQTTASTSSSSVKLSLLAIGRWK